MTIRFIRSTENENTYFVFDDTGEHIGVVQEHSDLPGDYKWSSRGRPAKSAASAVEYLKE